MRVSCAVMLGCLWGASFVSTLLADQQPSPAHPPWRVLPTGEVPRDARLGPLKGERGDFSFVPSTSPQQWKERSKRVRRMMRVSLGLWPWPTRTPLNAVVHGSLERDGYTVEKVYLESVPGFFVTGNLYRPSGAEGQRPAVLSAHGHFPGGRFLDEGRDVARQKIVAGAERFEEGGRSFMQSRCVQLARMGCVVFHFDMIGYGDSQQIALDVAHRFSRLRTTFQEPPPSGLYSAAALLHQQNSLGLHTYNSIRALDFLAGLPDVDPQRIAVTGGSGGGTQTFMLCALDDRPLVSVPVVIVSTTRQGGCTCENVCGLRHDAFNLEFTALHAPRPLLLISADDDTRTLRERGFPELEQHYRALGAANNVAHVPLLHFPHNYNYVSRAAMYRWLNRHLRLGLPGPIVEGPYERLTQEEMSVWDAEHPPPTRDPDFDSKLLEWFADDAERQLAALIPRDETSWQNYRAIVGGAWEVLLPGLTPRANVNFEQTSHVDFSDHDRSLGLLRYRTSQGLPAELPLLKLIPHAPGRGTVVWIDEQGKAGLLGAGGLPKPAARALLEAGYTVVGVDLLYQGEFLPDRRPLVRQRALAGEEAFAGWTYCYNLPVFAHRVQDVLAVIASARGEDRQSRPTILGMGGAGKWVAAAVSRSLESVQRAAIDTNGFRFAQVTDVYDVDFLPGAAKYQDINALLALSAPTPLWLAGETEVPPIASAAYRAVELPHRLVLSSTSTLSEKEMAAVAWICAGDLP